ncbi:hypothetical protein ACWIUD_07200 [Helicobacter sp. 23-1044]
MTSCNDESSADSAFFLFDFAESCPKLSQNLFPKSPLVSVIFEIFRRISPNLR